MIKFAKTVYWIAQVLNFCSFFKNNKYLDYFCAEVGKEYCLLKS